MAGLAGMMMRSSGPRSPLAAYPVAQPLSMPAATFSRPVAITSTIRRAHLRHGYTTRCSTPAWRTWWTVCSLLFLYTSAVKQGEQAGNLRLNRERHPALIGLTLRLAVDDSLGRVARSGATLIDALTPHTHTVVQLAELAPS